MKLSELSALAQNPNLLDAVHGQLLLRASDSLINPEPLGTWALQMLQGKRRGDVRAVTARLVCKHSLWAELSASGGLSDQTIRMNVDWACEGVIPGWTQGPVDPGAGDELQ